MDLSESEIATGLIEAVLQNTTADIYDDLDTYTIDDFENYSRLMAVGPEPEDIKPAYPANVIGRAMIMDSDSVLEYLRNRYQANGMIQSYLLKCAAPVTGYGNLYTMLSIGFGVLCGCAESVESLIVPTFTGLNACGIEYMTSRMVGLDTVIDAAVSGYEPDYSVLYSSMAIMPYVSYNPEKLSALYKFVDYTARKFDSNPMKKNMIKEYIRLEECAHCKQRVPHCSIGVTHNVICPICNKKVECGTIFTTHFVQEHQKKKTEYLCVMCNKVADLDVPLEENMVNHHKCTAINAEKCSCGKVIRKDDNAKKYHFITSPAHIIIRCACGDSIAKETMSEHLKEQKHQLSKCPNCKKFIVNFKLTSHEHDKECATK